MFLLHFWPPFGKSFNGHRYVRVKWSFFQSSELSISKKKKFLGNKMIK